MDDGDEIMHEESFLLSKHDVITGKNKTKKEVVITFFIPFPAHPDPSLIYTFSIISDKWIGSCLEEKLYTQSLDLPEEDYPLTKVAKLPLLKVSEIFKDKPKYINLYKGKLESFNKLQTQLFGVLYTRDENVLIGAPTGSGKTVMSELAMLRVFDHYPEKKIVYVAPLKALVKERVADWKKRLQQEMGKQVVELTGDYTPDLKSIENAQVIITTPEKW